jgi:cytochrome d ubiquinol oxidase subunit II
MHLYLIPLVFMLVGLAMYTVLAGADFGAGVWQLTAGHGSAAARIRDHAHRAIGPVWEANHVWLIFVLTVFWTSYPLAFGSIASTLSIPLFIAAIGIIMRGATYALRSGARSASETRAIDTVFGVSSILTPFALGAMVGAVATGRVPVGNARGNLISSWLNLPSCLIGALAVASGAYLAAVYLAADAVRLDDADLEREFRRRALLAGLVAGLLAVAGLVVLHADAHRLYHRLVSGAGVACLAVSFAAGLAALALVARARYALTRYVAALAVVAVIAGWAIAQQPILLPGLTLAQAAAPHDTLVLVVIAVLAGGLILFPALALLFRLVLQGRFDPNAQPASDRAGPAASHGAPTTGAVLPLGRGLLGRSAGASAIAAIGLLWLADAPWAHALGVVCVFAFIVLGFGSLHPVDLASAPAAEDRAH